MDTIGYTTLCRWMGLEMRDEPFRARWTSRDPPYFVFFVVFIYFFLMGGYSLAFDGYEEKETKEERICTVIYKEGGRY